MATYQPEDIQSILNWVGEDYKWPIEPLKVDGVLGSRSNEAIRVFKGEYNDSFAPDGGSNKLSADSHKIDKAFWGAVYDMFQYSLAESLKPPKEVMPSGPTFVKNEFTTPWMKELRNNLEWLADNAVDGVIACGESVPIESAEKTDYRSRTNRRVEMFLFDPDEVSRLQLDCKSKANCGKQSCSLYSEAGRVRWPRRYLSIHPDAEDEKNHKISFLLRSEHSLSSCGSRSFQIESVDPDVIIMGMTNDDGVFEVDDISPGTYTLKVGECCFSVPSIPVDAEIPPLNVYVPHYADPDEGNGYMEEEDAGPGPDEAGDEEAPDEQNGEYN